MKKNSATWNVYLLLLIAALSLFGCAADPEAASPAEETAQEAAAPGAIAAVYLEELAAAGQRTTGTEAETAGAEWVAGTLEELGYTITREPFEYEVEGTKFSSENIIAVKEGASAETVILGAHYDSVDVGSGVDDNGSGVAVVMEAANVLKDTETPQTIKFIFFGAEEAGLWGSAYHVAQMTAEDLENTVAMLNYDSLAAGDIAYVYGGGAGENDGKFRDRILAIAEANGIELITQPGDNPEYPAGTTGDWSDHAAFKDAGIPYVYFESTNWTLGAKDGYTQVDMTLGVNGEIWHTEFDTLDYLNEQFPGRAADRLTTFATVTEALLAEDLSAL